MKKAIVIIFSLILCLGFSAFHSEAFAKDKNAEYSSIIATKNNIVGSWVQQISYAPDFDALVLIMREGKGFVIEYHFAGNDVLKQELRKEGHKYIVVGNAFKEYYLINEKGVLGIYDKDGFIRSCQPFN